MKPTLIKIAKTAGLAAIGAVLSWLADNAAAVQALVPPKYAHFLALALLIAGAYHTPPPSGQLPSKPPTGAALLLMATTSGSLLSGLRGAVSHLFKGAA